MKLLIKSGRVIDPGNNLDEVLDILIEDSRITRLAKGISLAADEIVDARDKIVIPGLVDMHVHLREPGREDKETVASGTNAGLRGGVTTLLAMPNTSPAIDSVENIRLLEGIIRSTARAGVLIAGTITKGRSGKELADLAGFKRAGILAVSDDGSSVDSEELMLEALGQAHKEGLLVICHCEDKTLCLEGVVNLGLTSTRLGLRGISCESEYKRVERDIGLAERSGAALHIAHVSTKESVASIARAKKKGIRVTAETAPHYFSLTEEAVLGYDTNMKMNPPLRGEDDVFAIKEGLREGTIDAIASDHAPHTENEKEIEFARAEFGVIGLQTALSVAITELVSKGVLDWQGLVEKMAVNPARILGVKKGRLGVGSDADLVVVSPDKEWQVTKDNLVSISKNSAFLGRRLKGVVEQTIFNGKIAYTTSRD